MISVIVPAHNEEKLIEACLKSVRQQKFKDYELIVVDNNSTDGTAKIAKRHADKVLAEKRQGIAFARNTGAKKSKGSILAFLDSDCICSPNWLKAVASSINKNTVAATGPVWPMGAEPFETAYYTLVWNCLSRFLICIGTPALTGQNCAYRRKDFEEVGGFKTDMVPAEDIALSSRLRREGRFAFSKGMHVWTTARRFRECGYLHETARWMKVPFMVQRKKAWDIGYPVIR